MTGTITKRGKKSWRIKYDLPRDENGQRHTAYVTVKGTRKDADTGAADAIDAVFG